MSKLTLSKSQLQVVINTAKRHGFLEVWHDRHEFHVFTIDMNEEIMTKYRNCVIGGATLIFTVDAQGSTDFREPIEIIED